MSWRNRILQLDKQHQKLVLARKKIPVSELLDGTLRLTFRCIELSWRELPSKPVVTPAKTKARQPPKAP